MNTFEGRKIIEELLVEGVKGSENIYVFLPGKLVTIPARKGIKKAFSRKQILINGRFGSSQDRVSNNDRVQILEYLGTVSKVYELDLNVIYEDDYLAIVEKPPGLPTSGNKWKTLQNAVPVNIKRSTQDDSLAVPLTVHRLDAKTHGIVLVAKTSGARIRLGEMLEYRQINKTYTAIVQGKLEGSGSIDGNVGGKNALTHYNAQYSFPHVKDELNTVVELSPVTGRKHQLRIHLTELGYPIIGDVKYSEKSNVLRGKGFFLSANRISFCHPCTQEELDVKIELPNKFNRYIGRMERWHNRVRKD